VHDKFIKCTKPIKCTAQPPTYTHTHQMYHTRPTRGIAKHFTTFYTLPDRNYTTELPKSRQWSDIGDVILMFWCSDVLPSCLSSLYELREFRGVSNRHVMQHRFLSEALTGRYTEPESTEGSGSLLLIWPLHLYLHLSTLHMKFSPYLTCFSQASFAFSASVLRFKTIVSITLLPQ